MSLGLNFTSSISSVESPQPMKCVLTDKYFLWRTDWTLRWTCWKEAQVYLWNFTWREVTHDEQTIKSRNTIITLKFLSVCDDRSICPISQQLLTFTIKSYFFHDLRLRLVYGNTSMCAVMPLQQILSKIWDATEAGGKSTHVGVKHQQPQVSNTSLYMLQTKC